MGEEACRRTKRAHQVIDFIKEEPKVRVNLRKLWNLIDNNWAASVIRTEDSTFQQLKINFASLMIQWGQFKDLLEFKDHFKNHKKAGKSLKKNLKLSLIVIVVFMAIIHLPIFLHQQMVVELYLIKGHRSARRIQIRLFNIMAIQTINTLAQHLKAVHY